MNVGENEIIFYTLACAYREIPDLDMWISKLVNSKDVSDPFVNVKLGKARIAKSAIIDNSLNPKWNESFKVEVCHRASNVIFDVRDKDHVNTEAIGKVQISTSEIIDGNVVEGWFPIMNNSKVNCIKYFCFLKNILLVIRRTASCT